jgi:hypothetical protein
MRVITKLRGGLGNQLFQYAAGLHLATHYDGRLFTDVRSYQPPQKIWHLRRTTPRTLQLELLGLPILYYQPCKMISRTHHRFGSKETSKKTKSDATQRVFREVDSWSDVIAGSRGTQSVFLDGYWQDLEIVKPVLIQLQETIRRNFVPPAQLRPFLELASNPNTLTVHVRRGDICRNNRLRKIHGCLSEEYFRSAIDELRDERPIDHLLVLSDDIRWCRRNLSLSLPLTFSPRACRTPASDLYLATNARQFVMSNSSFSWWAASLNSNPGRLIVSPGRWKPGKNTEDFRLFNPEWRLRSPESTAFVS